MVLFLFLNTKVRSLKRRIYAQLCVEVQPCSLLGPDIDFDLMSLDQLVDEYLDWKTGGEEDPGGKGDHSKHRRVETLPGEVEALQGHDDQSHHQDVRAPPQLELAEMVSPGEE